jgi:hypothetical protein
MLTELDAYGIDGHAWRLIKEWYEHYRARVALDKKEGRFTRDFGVHVGTRQGSVLSPIFFAIAMNGLIRRLKNAGWEDGGKGLGIQVGSYKLPILMQADDIVLLAPTVTELQTLLDLTAKHMAEWKMPFQLAKCNVMALRQPNPSPLPQLTLEIKRPSWPGLCRSDIKWCEKSKYLGVMLSQGEDTLLPGLLDRRAATEGWGNELAAIALSKSRTDLASVAEVFLSRIAPKLDYGLHALPLREYHISMLDDAESTLLRKLKLTQYIPVHKRFRARYTRARTNLLRKLRKSPLESWRRYLVDDAVTCSGPDTYCSSRLLYM